MRAQSRQDATEASEQQQQQHAIEIAEAHQSLEAAKAQLLESAKWRQEALSSQADVGRMRIELQMQTVSNAQVRQKSYKKHKISHTHVNEIE